MRIAVFTENFLPEISGITDTIVRTGTELAERGHALLICAPNYAARATAAAAVPALHPNIHVIRFSSLPYKMGTGQGRMVVPTGLRWTGFRSFRPDIVHVHSPFGMGLEGLATAKALRIPMVGTNHTPFSEFMHYTPVRFPGLTPFALRYSSWFYNRCAFVSSPAQAIFNEMEHYGLSVPHRVVANPVDTAVYTVPGSGETQQRKTKLGLEGFTVLYAGRLAAEKRIDVLFRAVAKLAGQAPDIRIALSGVGVAQQGLEALARELGIAERVKFFGLLSSQAEIANIYQASDLFVIMSTSDTQSIAAMQAMAVGIPVIGADAWGLPEYIKEDRGFIVEPGDTDALSQKMLMLYRDTELREKLGRGGRRFAETIAPGVIADQWEVIYRAARARVC